MIKVLVVGGGLAGSLLAWELHQRGIAVRMVFDPAIASASRVAAGLINPVLGQRLVLQADYHQHWLHACQCYEQLARQFGQPFLHHRSMLRVMLSTKQAERWQKRQQQADYANLLGQAQHIPWLNAPDGCFMQEQTAYLDIPCLLDALHGFFRQRGCLHETALNYDALQLHQHGVRWQQHDFSHIVFCEGWRVCHNPWFSTLPMRPAKGDILRLQVPAHVSDAIINKGHWLCPRGGSTYWFGASFEADNTDETTSRTTRHQLLAHYRSLFKQAPATACTAHHTGIRPATADKQALLGRHPEFPQLLVCNGFGSHGSLRMPRHIALLADHLQHHQPLPKNIDVRRCLA